jgi:hypothetical protein
MRAHAKTAADSQVRRRRADIMLTHNFDFGLGRENISRIVCPAERKAESADHCYSFSSSSRVLASFRSGESKPSVNQL